MIWSISWKNIWRNKLRSSVVIIAVTLGVFGGTISMSIMKSMSDKRLKSAIEIEVSHIQLHNELFMDNKEIQFTIDDAGSIIENIKKIPEVKGVSKRTKILAMASTASNGTGVMVNGIFPDMEKEVSMLYEKVCDSCGTFFETGKGLPIVISKKLAEKLNVKIRSKIILTFQSDDGNLIGGAFRVAGIFKTDNSTWDELNVFVKSKDIIDLAGFNDNKIHEIAILLNDTEDAEAVTQKIKSQFGHLNVMQWKEIQPELGMMNDMVDQMLYIFMLIILLALGFGIVNTMLMVILERVRELGMLMAVGMNKLRLFNMIMLETIFLSLTGGVLGMIIGALFIEYFGEVGIDLSIVSEGLETFGYSAYIYPEIGLDYYIVLTIMVIFTGIIASIYPAVKALKLKPAEAIRAI